ncbi:MAG: regulator [Candidatus Hydrogenedentes bacterium]|nr:regulator [Candidatus Hydrogenedentota bacterium]
MSVSRFFATLISTTLIASSSFAESLPIEDTPFIQEYHEAFPLASEGENDVRAIDVDKLGGVWAATRDGVRVLESGVWSTPPSAGKGPAFNVFCDSNGASWVGAWDGLYVFDNGGGSKIDFISEPISAVCETPDSILAAGPENLWRFSGGAWHKDATKWPRSVSEIAYRADSGLWMATGLGLYNKSDKGDHLYYKQPDELVSGAVRGVALGNDGRVWAGCLGGLTVLTNGARTAGYTPAEGLPNYDVRCVAIGPDGRIWVGTALGVARLDESTKQWSLRHSRRWLLDDEVRDIAFDRDGNAWIATKAGVSAIKRKTMTLEEKAAHFLDIQHKRHVRAPWIVERCKLRTPGDVTTFAPEDDDNDGSYTAYYMIQELYRYAVTKDAAAKEHAKKAFELIEFLQSVTGTSGFIARTIVPSDWDKMHDGNETVSPERRAESRVNDPRWKPVEKRWRPSADGKWLWKGDTSSDEIIGHFNGFFAYYTLMDEESEKELVRNLTRRIMDYIIEGGYNLNDIDGTHTRWGVWSPDKLLGDPDWRAERGINATELLMFLKTSYFITGDKKYQEHYEKLIKDDGYAELARHAKTYHPSERTHIDDELLSFAYPALLSCENDPALLSIYRESFDWWYKGLSRDESPYFNFVYGAYGGKEFNPEDAVEYLRDAPLDLIDWRVDNSTREDVTLVRAPEIEPLQTDRMLPPSERAVMRWDKNPWMAVNGSNGDNEQSGAGWLMPYWFGRYHGYIGQPKK